MLIYHFALFISINYFKSICSMISNFKHILFRKKVYGDMEYNKIASILILIINMQQLNQCNSYDIVFVSMENLKSHVASMMPLADKYVCVLSFIFLTHAKKSSEYNCILESDRKSIES